MGIVRAAPAICCESAMAMRTNTNVIAERRRPIRLGVRATHRARRCGVHVATVASSGRQRGDPSVLNGTKSLLPPRAAVHNRSGQPDAHNSSPFASGSAGASRGMGSTNDATGRPPRARPAPPAAMCVRAPDSVRRPQPLHCSLQRGNGSAIPLGLRRKQSILCQKRPKTRVAIGGGGGVGIHVRRRCMSSRWGGDFGSTPSRAQRTPPIPLGVEGHSFVHLNDPSLRAPKKIETQKKNESSGEKKTEKKVGIKR